MEYPKQRSRVTITFIDGEVKVYEISAGASISGYLMRDAGNTGIVTLRDDEAQTAVCVPLERIRDIAFAPHCDQRARHERQPDEDLAVRQEREQAELTAEWEARNGNTP
jgi:hypothetical protein